MTTTRRRRSVALLLLPIGAMAALSSSTSKAARRLAASAVGATEGRVVCVPESSWREAAASHRDRVRALLAPGLTSPDDPRNSGRRRQRRRRLGGADFDEDGGWTSLDPKNPVYNFLIEYYGIKGAKGPRRLARWSPDPSLLLRPPKDPLTRETAVPPSAIAAVHEASRGAGGILLESATANDMGGMLHLRGATFVNGVGVLYSPSLHFGRYDDDDDVARDGKKDKSLAAAPYQWYRSILASTLSSDPVLHCHGVHEWAMIYHPQGAPPPPSGKYQAHLPLRVDRDTINRTVERRGISCTHVDALRFFAPAAGPLNHHGARLERTDQLRLEQQGCVHAHMDLLKIALRLQPFVDSMLVGDALEVALEARRLDVAASPYDGSAYGVDVVPVERALGRKIYRERQVELMDVASPVRERLLQAYDDFLELAFDDSVLRGASHHPAPERYAKAEPGGKPWRQNLI